MSFGILVYQNRTASFEGFLSQRDGTPYILGPFDKLRFKMGRCDDPLVFDILSDSPTMAGSYIEITTRGSDGNPPAVPATPATYLARIAQGDVATTIPGSYSAEITAVDATGMLADLGEQGVIDVISTLGGSIGYT